MTKFTQIVFLIALFVLGIGRKEAQATHLMGADMQWKCLGNDTYEIKIVVYRRCTDGATTLSIYPPTVTSDSCANSYTVTVGSLIEHLTEDITPVCASQQKPCPSAGGNGQSTAQMPFGVERHTMRYKLYLGGNYANCCWYKLQWQQAARNSNITTGFADQNFLTESWLNRCVAPCDNGPEFRNPPIAIKCAGQDVCFNHGVFDEDGDSLSYAMAPPLGGGSYSSPWSYTYPLTCLGGNSPNPNANPPTGFNLDPRTGDMCFRPMQVQITVLKIMVTEWRKDTAGIYRVIGKTARDMQFIIVQNCNNKLPSLSGPFSYEACAGQQICITINTNDQDLTDTTRIFWNKGIPNAQWSDNNGTVKRASGTLCWTPSDDDASTLPYYFTATVNDDHCPLNGSTTRSYSITVKPTPKNNRAFTNKGCGLYEFAATPTSSYFNGATYKWYVPKLVGTGSPVTVYSNSATTTYQFTVGGKFLIKNTMFFNGCTNTYFDTLLVDTPISVVCMPDSHICIGKNIALTCDVKHGVFPLRYQWSSSANDTFSTVTVSPVVSRYYKVTVSDFYLCTVSDSVFIDVKPLPVVSLPPDERLCYGENFVLDAGNLGADYVWYQDGSSLATTQTITVKDSGQYTLQVIDSFGCENFDTFNLYVNPQVIVGPLVDELICYGDTVTLTETGADSYEWKNDKNSTTITGSSITVNPTVTTTYYIKGTKTEQGKTCYGYDTVIVNVNTLPTITFPTFPKRCINGGYIVLAGTVKVNNVNVPPTYVNWTSSSQPNAIILDNITGAFYFDPVQTPASGGIYYVVMEAIAPNGCKVIDSTTVEIVPPPVVLAGTNKSFCVNYTNCFNLDTMGQPYGGRWYILDASKAISYPLDSTPIGGGKYSYCFDPVKAGDGATHLGETYQLVYWYKELVSPACANSDTVDFTVTPIPVVDAGIDTAICVGSGMLNLTNNVHNSPIDGTWWGPGVLPDSANFNPNYNTTGTSQTYTLYYRVTRIGCSDMDSMQITVHPIPQPTITASSYKVCKTDPTIVLTPTPGGNGSRYFLDGTEIFTTSVTPSLTDTGWHVVRYSYTNPVTNCSKDTSLRLYIEQPPHVSIDPMGGLCAQKSQDSGVVIHGHCYAPYGFKWVNIGGGTLKNSVWTDSVITYIPSAAEVAAQKMSIAILSVGNTYCRYDSAYAESPIYPTPVVSFTSPQTVGCVPFTTTFNDTNLNRDNATYWWDFGDPASGALNNDTNRNPQHTFNAPGIYSVKLTVKSKEGCDETATRMQLIEVYPIPKVDFSFDPHAPDWATVALPKYKFKDLTDNNGFNIKSWDWDFGDGIGTSKEQNPEYLYKINDPVGDTGWRTITLRVVSEKGDCYAEMKHDIYIGPDLTVFIPNAFSPDEDGPTPNEKFRVVATGIKTFEIYIYNRWGEELYRWSDYKTHGWDGTFKGGPVPMDVYIYKVLVTAYDDKKYEYDGTVHVIR